MFGPWQQVVSGLSNRLPSLPAHRPQTLTLESSAYILPLIVWVYLHSNFSGGLRKTFFYFCNSDVSTLQGHPRSLILVSIESAYAVSYQTVIVTLVLSCTVTEILSRFCAPGRLHPYSTLFGGVPVGPHSPFWGQFKRYLKQFGREIIVEVF